MWLWMTLGSAVLLGFYDIAKKQAVKNNGVLYVLLGATALSAVFLCPFLSPGSATQHAKLLLKGVLVTASWVSGLAALKTIPITTASTIKASRPVIVVALSMLFFGERLNACQWGGVILAIAALWMLSRSSRKEGIPFTGSKGIGYMVISVLTGAASALFDKYIMGEMEPLFVQSWSNVYISALLALCICFRMARNRGNSEKFHWDWNILLIAVLITCADALYFFALKQEGALLSVISLIRRSSVIITFTAGSLIFGERHTGEKAVSLAALVAAMALLFAGSAIDK